MIRSHIRDMTVTAYERFLHSGKLVSACALGGAWVAGVTLVWIPSLVTVDVHAIGAVVGGVAGAIAHARHII